MSSERGSEIRRAKVVALFAALLVAGAGGAAAKPAFMDRYNADPFARAELRNKCTVCHLGHGGGERTDFGEAFADAGYRITPKLRAKFPSVFTAGPAKP